MGMNSHFSVYDELIMDPLLTETVPFEQYFYTAMDIYCCIESLNGSMRNLFSDTFSRNTLDLCREIFTSENPMSDNKERKTNACIIFWWSFNCKWYGWFNSSLLCWTLFYFGSHHCVSNCVVMLAMDEYCLEEVERVQEIYQKLPN